jgi:hypothetical protein
MNNLKKQFASIFFILVLFFSFVISWNLAFKNTTGISAIITKDEAILCVLLNTYLDDDVDIVGLSDCLYYMDQD